MSKNKKDYCSGIPDTIFGVSIKHCCKKHDNDCGQKGSYNIIITTKTFYDCLNKSKLSKPLVYIITFGGTLFCLLEYPILCYKKYKWRKENGNSNNK